MKAKADVRILEQLLRDKRISGAQYDAVLMHLQLMGGRVEEAILSANALSEAELLRAMAMFHQTRFVTTDKLSKADIGRVVLDKVSVRLAEMYGVFPIVWDAKTLSLLVVTSDPDNLEALKEVQIYSGAREVRAMVGRPAAVRAAIAKAYRGDVHAFAVLNSSGPDIIHSGTHVLDNNVLDNKGAPPESIRPDPAGQGPTKTEASRVSQRFGSSIAPPPPASVAVPDITNVAVTSPSYVETLNVLVSLIENARAELRGHSSQVARLTRKLAERIGLGAEQVAAMTVAAHVHDLGKMSAYHLTALNVGQYDGHRIAAHKSYLTPVRLLDSVNLNEGTVQSLQSMYERYDSAGIPGQLRGQDIPLGARILAITDSYADITHNPRNPYRKILSPQQASETLAQFKGVLFDPNLVDLLQHLVTGDDLKERLLAVQHSALVIDPDPEETTMLELRMIEQGFDVLIARNSDQAFKLLSQGDYELVVSEVDLQPEDGFALLSAVRNKLQGKTMPWVFFTRRATRSDVQKGFELGATDYVPKPAHVEALVAKLKQTLQRTTMKQKGVSGSLSEMGLPDIVQILWHGRKTGALFLQFQDQPGEIHFQQGNIVNAILGEIQGEDAFYAMLRFDQGQFSLDPNYVPKTQMINASPESLLLEGMRRLDEGL